MSQADDDYDLAVVGAGSAGFAAAISGAEQGARVALVGAGLPGGTCVNVGCVPSKTLIRAAEALHQGRSASRFAGIGGTGALHDWAALQAQKERLVADLPQSKYLDLLKAYRTIEYREGPACLVPGGLSIGGAALRAGKTIISTGARPLIPAIAGIEGVDFLDSTAAMALRALPGSLLVVGGGYVGVELAQMFARAGGAVTLACRSRLLPAAEPELAEALTQYLRAEGITVLCGLAYKRGEATDDGVALSVERDGVPQVIAAERLLLATGRRANVEGLGLAEQGIRQGGNGGIQVDAYLRTTQPDIYAAGDVTGRDLFVYMAAYAGRIAAENALGGDRHRYESGAMPRVVFTDPQLASVGLTETEARRQGYDVATSILSLDRLPRALVAHDTRGLIKLVAEPVSGRLLGAHILAPEGADSIQTAALAIRQGLSVDELAGMIFPYLTTVEGLKLAAQGFRKDISRLSCCAG